MQPNHSTQQRQQAKYIGLILALLSFMSIFVMLHHPSISTTDIYEQIKEINQESQINSFVHGVLITFTLLMSFCLTFYSQLRGIHRVSILLGLLCFWLGTFAMVNAALMSGFVGPYLAEVYQLASAEQLEVFAGLNTMKLAINQAFANFGALCWCGAMGCWAMDMLKRGLNIRIFAAISFVTATAIAISLVANWLSLNVFGMTLVLVAVCTWQLGIAWLLYSYQQSHM